MVTFQVSEKKAEVVGIRDVQLDYMPLFEKTVKASGFLQGSLLSSNFTPKANGFVETVVTAYNGHHNLVIRPDDVWLSIMSQFALFVERNSELLRNKFVSFTGKKELSVTLNGRSKTFDMDVATDLFIKKLRENLTDGALADWILPHFTTTKRDDITVASVIFMASMKKYFDYKMMLLCGIPNVTILGCKEDWLDIRSRLEKLKEYGLTDWSESLIKIVDQFINVFDGIIDLSFWGKICHYKEGGSGPSYLSGWITVFTSFDEKGCWQGNPTVGNEYPKIDTTDIAPGYCSVPLKIDDNGLEFDGVFFAGHTGYTAVDKFTIAPMLTWSVYKI